MITQELVRKLFDYNPETGILTNKIARGSRARAGDIAGGANGRGYLFASINGRNHSVHRICFLHYHGYLPPMVDHKDTNRLNNRILNLRKCTSQQNNFNAKIGKDNTSGIKGVSWSKKERKWLAQIRVDGKCKHIGRFSDIADARKAVETARARHHKEFANHG